MKVSIYLVQAVQACLAAEGTPLSAKLRDIIEKAAKKTSKPRGATGIRRLASLAESRANNSLLSFDLEEFDLDIACLALSDPNFISTTMNVSPGVRKNHARIYTAWSVTQRGYAWISPTQCKYLPDWDCEVPEEGDSIFELKPAFRKDYAEAVKQATDFKPTVRCESRDKLTFFMDVQHSAGEIHEHCRCWLADGTSDPQLLRGTKLESNDSGEIGIEFANPEAVLQLSAAAMQSRWLVVEGTRIDAIFPVPDIGVDNTTSPLWFRHAVPGHGYLKGRILARIAIPKNLALECIRQFWWLTLEDKSAMIHALSNN
jgi:hypothetical protein